MELTWVKDPWLSPSKFLEDVFLKNRFFNYNLNLPLNLKNMGDFDFFFKSGFVKSMIINWNDCSVVL